MKRERILVVEDEEIVGLAIKTHLESVGYDVPQVVSTGEQAVEQTQALEPDLVLMDIRLQGAMDGIQAAAAIKDSSHVPVIYLTAYSDVDTLRKARVTEPYGYILKPFDERALEASIEMALYKAARQKEQRRSNEQLITILQSIKVGIIVAGMRGFVEYVNPPAAALLDLTLPLPESTSVVKLIRLAASRNEEPSALPLNEVLLDGKTVSYENCLLVTEKGTRLTADLNLQPHRDTSGVIQGVVLSFRGAAQRRSASQMIAGELQAAKDIHRSLLPADGVSIGPYVMHGFLFPATFGAGDLYGFHSIDKERAGFFIIDVAGHGVAATSTALLVNRLLTPMPGGDGMLAFLGVNARKPREVVARLNGLFYGSGATFFTLCYGVIDSRRRTLRIVRAGHPFPILLRAAGSLEEIDVEGPAIGPSINAEAEEAEITLDPGDRFFLYSDGLTECSNPTEVHFSRDRLLDLIRTTRNDQLQAAVARIALQVKSWRGKESYDDDVTLAAIELAETSK